MIKLQHVEMLLAIERAGSIRAASKRLGKSQPAITKALRQAETELGAAIFKRAPSGVAVTEEGKRILRCAGPGKKWRRESSYNYILNILINNMKIFTYYASYHKKPLPFSHR